MCTANSESRGVPRGKRKDTVGHGLPPFPDVYGVWLDPAMRDVEPVQALLTPYPAEEMVAYPASTRVNSPANDAPDLVEALSSVSR